MKRSQIVFSALIGLAVIAGIVHLSIQKTAAEPTVKIGYLQIVAGLPAHVMRHEKSLEAKGVKYELVPLSSSNEAYDALVRGDIDIMGGISYLPVFLNNAKQPGVVKLFRPFDLTKDGLYDVTIVKKDSPIKSIQNLAGKKVGTYPGNTLTNFEKYYLAKAGVNIATTTFVQLPAANLLQALEAGSIDAAVAYQPNALIALESGNFVQLEHDVYANSFDHAPIGGAAIRSSFLEQQPELAEKAYTAIEAAYQSIQDHPSEARTVLADFLKLDPALAQKVPLPAYSPVYDSQQVQQLIDFLVQIGELKTTVDADSLRYR